MPRTGRSPRMWPDIGRRGRSRRLVGRLYRHRHPFILQGRLLQLLLLGGERRCDAVAPLAVEEGGILFVDMLLLLRRRVRAGGIKTAVLHEIIISVAAAGLAPAGEFPIAFGERRTLCFLGPRFFPALVPLPQI